MTLKSNDSRMALTMNESISCLVVYPYHSTFILSLILQSVGLAKHDVESLFEHVSKVSLDVKF